MAYSSIRKSFTKRQQKELEQKKTKNCRITYKCDVCNEESYEYIKANTLSLDDLSRADDYGLTLYLKKDRKHLSLEECVKHLCKVILNHRHDGPIST